MVAVHGGAVGVGVKIRDDPGQLAVVGCQGEGPAFDGGIEVPLAPVFADIPGVEEAGLVHQGDVPHAGGVIRQQCVGADQQILHIGVVGGVAQERRIGCHGLVRQVVVHPQSIIHSMIEYEDGAVIAQLGTPDMKLPIQYALYYPERKGPTSAKLDFAKLRALEFFEPDTEVFPALSMAYEALSVGGSMPTVYNAANEWAVAAFLDRKIGYTDIVANIQKEMEAHQVIANPSLEEILATESEVYRRLNR